MTKLPKLPIGYRTFNQIRSEGCLHFLMRVKTKWNAEVDAASEDGIFELSNGRSIRVVKFKLPSVEEETLITDLFELAHEAFMELCFKRWPIEPGFPARHITRRGLYELKALKTQEIYDSGESQLLGTKRH